MAVFWRFLLENVSGDHAEKPKPIPHEQQREHHECHAKQPVDVDVATAL